MFVIDVNPRPHFDIDGFPRKNSAHFGLKFKVANLKLSPRAGNRCRCFLGGRLPALPAFATLGRSRRSRLGRFGRAVAVGKLEKLEVHRKLAVVGQGEYPGMCGGVVCVRPKVDAASRRHTVLVEQRPDAHLDGHNLLCC
eukprot:scaffold335630_cov36-Prasinocladus_malaysianus.AAC.2